MAEASAAMELVASWLSCFEASLNAGDFSETVSFFEDGDCLWRDLVAFTWNIKTLEGKSGIEAMLRAQVSSQILPCTFSLEGDASVTEDRVTEAWFVFSTRYCDGRGHVRLRGGKCWTLLTAMDELKGYETRSGPTRDPGVEHGARRGRTTWMEHQEAERASLGVSDQPFVVVVGGGQGGIALGAQLRRLDVPTIILESNKRAGDSWRKRYKSLCLHDPVWYDHMPFLPFPNHWPIFTPKDKVYSLFSNKKIIVLTQQLHQKIIVTTLFREFVLCSIMLLSCLPSPCAFRWPTGWSPMCKLWS